MIVFPLLLHKFLRYVEQACNPLHHGWVWTSASALTKSCVCRCGGRLGGEHRVWCALVVIFPRSSPWRRCHRCWWGWHFSRWRRRQGWSRLLECWRMVWLKHSWFPLPNYHRRYDRGEVGLRCRVQEFLLYRSFVYPPSVLRMLSKASNDNFSCSQTSGTVGAFGSTPVTMRHVTTARIISPGVESTKKEWK